MKDRSVSKQNKVNFCLVSAKNDSKWVQGIISYINISSKDIEVFLSDEDMQNLYSKGDRVIIKSLNNQNEFLFSGSVRKIASSLHKKALIVKIDNIREYINYRENERYYVNFDAFIITPDGGRNRANIMDISLGGISMISDGHMRENSTVDVEIVSDPENPIALRGKIIRKKRYKRVFKYGIIIEKMDEHSENLLDALIKLLRSKKTDLEHSWKIFKRIRLAVYSISALIAFFVVFIALASKSM